MGELGTCPELLSKGKVLDHLSSTLKIGSSVKRNIETLCRENECIRAAMHSESTAHNASEKKKINITSEITMLYTIRSTIEKLEYCSRSLSNLLKDLSSVSMYSKSNSDFSISEPRKSEISNNGIYSENPNHLHCESSTRALIFPEKRVLDERFECDESHSRECKTQNTRFGAIIKSFNVSSLVAFESNMEKNVIDVNEKKFHMNPGSKMECVSESHANELSSKNDSTLKNFDSKSRGLSRSDDMSSVTKSTGSPSTPLRGWAAKNEKLRNEGIDVYKCSTCGKFKRSFRKGEYKSHCRCIKRSKEEHVTTVLIPYTSENCMPDDGYTWRKYGQKVTKPESFPRAYFKCTRSKNCSAKRHIERNNENPDMIIVTYVGQHNH